MQPQTPNSFTGLLIPDVPIKPTDYIQGDGKLGALGVRVLNPTAKWRDYKAPIQYQSNKKGFDSQNCTGFNYVRPVATTLNFIMRANFFSNRAIEWAAKRGYIKNGSFLFDPHALGIMAGTTSAGNWLQVVADTARKGGLLPAGTLPAVDNYQPGDYSGYYDKSLVTPLMLELAHEFLEYFILPYQWTSQPPVTTEHNALTACALYSAVCTCAGWTSQPNPPPVKWCNAGDATNHAVGQSDDQEIMDSYDPDIKQLSADYNIPFQMMVLAAEGIKTMKLVKDKGTVYLVAGINQKVKTGIASIAALQGMFGDEAVEDGDTSAIPAGNVLTDDALVVHKVAKVAGTPLTAGLPENEPAGELKEEI